MKSLTFNKISSGVSQTTIDNIIETICASKAVTRAMLAEACKTSIATVSKTARALIDSGTISEKTLSRDASLGKRTCSHLSVSRRICTAVIDLSSHIYSLDIICGGESFFKHTVKYDSSIPFEDNLYSLISRAFAQIRLKENFFLSVCVLYSDIKDSDAEHAYFPGIHDKEIIDATVFEVCKQLPLLYIPKSQAVRDAVKFNIVTPADGFGGVSYLSLGSVNAAFYIYGDHLTSCKIQNLIINDGITLKEFARGCMSRVDFELLLERSVNFIDSAFSAQALIIETDLFKIDASYIRALERKFASMRISPPDMYPICKEDDMTSLLALSAARRSEAELIKSCVIGKK